MAIHTQRRQLRDLLELEALLATPEILYCCHKCQCFHYTFIDGFQGLLNPQLSSHQGAV